jgi:hypothetical protein
VAQYFHKELGGLGDRLSPKGENEAFLAARSNNLDVLKWLDGQGINLCATNTKRLYPINYVTDKRVAKFLQKVRKR